MPRERISEAIFDRVDYANIDPVDSALINFGYIQQGGEPQIIKENSISFEAPELLNLSQRNLNKLSKKLDTLFKRISWKIKIPLDPTDKNMFEEGDRNTIAHELAHLSVIQELRPETAYGASINVLPLKHNGLLKIASNVIVGAPKVPYTVLEQTRIMMAPVYPSHQDYKNLVNYFKDHGVSAQELYSIIGIVSKKPESTSRNSMLAILDANKNM